MRGHLLAITLLASITTLGAATDGSWLKNVPQQERARQNPYAENKDAVVAGGILFKRNCASCHGLTAQGLGSRPTLQSMRVHDATDGELHWLLTNGNLRHGMPSWLRLPDAQRWQIVRYLHSLPSTPSSGLVTQYGVNPSTFAALVILTDRAKVFAIGR
jgi:mono/diheme cytochrome c family protein